MKNAFDIHAFIGLGAITVSQLLSVWSVAAGAAGATLGALYMGLRCWTQWRKLKMLDEKQNTKHNEKN